MSMMQRRRALMGAGVAPVYEHGTWEDLFYHIAKGDYATEYAVGEVLPLDLGTQGVVNAKIVGFDKDDLSTTGTAPVSFVSQYLLATARRFNPALSPSEPPYDTGTGGIGGWGSSEVRTWLKTAVLPLFPSAIRTRIVEVKKTTKGFTTSGTVQNGQQSVDDIWMPSMKEMANSQDSGIYYGADVVEKIQTLPNGTRKEWYQRSCVSTTNAYTTNTNGYQNGKAVTNSYNILIGFCVG